MGYIIVGIILGQSGLKVIDKHTIQALVPFNYFALGLIGFMIGTELRRDVFRRYGRQFMIILFSEGLVAFFAVFLIVGLLGSIFLKSGPYYWMLGLLLGSIASATAPAATTDVLWEYKTRGPLTTTVLGIVALDDGLALILFAVASSIATKVLGFHSSSLLSSAGHLIYEIGAAILLGIGISFLLIKILKKYSERDKMLIFAISSVLFALGLSLFINIDMLLTVMTLGVVLANLEPRFCKDISNLISGFDRPFYILFFVLVGAKFNPQFMRMDIVFIAIFYLIARSAGKMLGANLGAKVAGASKAVARYLPLCLFSQAGVAIGLSIIASHIFPDPVGSSIVFIITLTTFVVQLLGPPCVKYAVAKAGEVGLNITAEDVLHNTKLIEAMDKNTPFIYENMKLQDILNIFSESNYHFYPVINKEKKLSGVISLESIRQSFMYSEMGHFFLAHGYYGAGYK